MYLRIRKTDFYFGAFLSVIINHGIEPKFIESGVTGKTYRISNKENKISRNIFLKYRTSPMGYNDYWNINFTKNDIDMMKKHSLENNTCLVGLILTDNNLDGDNTEFLIVTIEELKECIDFESEDKRRLSIQKVSDSQDLRIYGSIREAKSYGADNRIRINRNRILFLLEDENQNSDIWNLD